MPILKAFFELYSETIQDAELYTPYLEDADIDKSLDGEWLSTEQQYLAAVKAFDAAKAVVDQFKSDLIALADGRKCHSNNLTVYSTQRKGSIAYAKVLDKLNVDVDLEEFRGKPSVSWTVKVKK